MKHVGFFYVNCGLPEMEVMATLMIASVKEVIPDAHISQFTNEATPALLGVDERIVRPVGKQGLMESRADHYARVKHETLFLDPDIIVQKNPREVFAEDFDVALTKRRGELFVNGVDTHGSMPYNTGVSFCRNPRFWRAVHNEMKSMPFKERNWLGEQIAVANVVKSGEFNVLTLSCDDYNYSPETKHEDVSGRFIVHYKGPIRKHWMLDMVTA